MARIAADDSLPGAVSLATGTAADAFVPSDEEQRIRETVAAIANRYGREYMRRCSAEERPPVELWDELAAAGYLGVNIPAEYDGGGLGMTALAAVGEELAAAGTPLVKCVDRAIQTHGGNGVALEYGLADLWWGVRTAKIAPVSREMILNYVAEHSLRLPRSY
jgi:alkylation response protein AidB-like acyl-CoA dehydrogenase